MAIAYESYTNITGSGSSTAVVTKPTGLVEGDLMIGYAINNTADSITIPTGWTELSNEVVSTTAYSAIGYKIADASDEAASNFTFTFGGNANYMATIIRLSGSFDVSLIKFSEGTHAGSISTIAPASIDANASSLMILLGAIADNDVAAIDFSGWAIANNNPSWTERMNESYDAGDVFQAFATATRPESGATGVGTINSDTSADRFFGYMMSISEKIDVTINADVVSLTSSLPSVSVSGGASVTAPVVTGLFTVFDPSVNVQTVDWTYESRPAPSTWIIEEQI